MSCVLTFSPPHNVTSKQLQNLWAFRLYGDRTDLSYVNQRPSDGLIRDVVSNARHCGRPADFVTSLCPLPPTMACCSEALRHTHKHIHTHAHAHAHTHTHTTIDTVSYTSPSPRDKPRSRMPSSA